MWSFNYLTGHLRHICKAALLEASKQAIAGSHVPSKHFNLDNARQVCRYCLLTGWSLWNGVWASGYYLHGQTALQHADIALPEITQLLDDEAKNISAHRGVLTGEDQQEFYMFVADETRDQYAAYADQIR